MTDISMKKNSAVWGITIHVELVKKMRKGDEEEDENREY